MIPRVTGIDRDEQSITVARARDAAGDIDYRCADFLDLPLRPGGFGLVTAVASLHHMNTAAALNRMREQLRPGGVLVIVGLARDGWSPVDLAFEVPAAANLRIQRARYRSRPRPDGYQPPIVWPPGRDLPAGPPPRGHPAARHAVPASPALALLDLLGEARLRLIAA